MNTPICLLAFLLALISIPPAVGNTKGDWEFCYHSDECRNSCCSRLYSDDRKYKCTPVGGFKPDQGCVYGHKCWMTHSAHCVFNRWIGNWQFCKRSSECNNGCCSSRYSHDGNLKCTPVGGFKPDQGCVAWSQRKWSGQVVFIVKWIQCGWF